MPRRPPPVAGRYVLLEPLGRGGQAVVHRALDLRTRQQVAAKVVRGRDHEALQRIVAEQALRIEHPHVLAPLGWAAEDDVALIALELVLGGSVRDLLAADGPQPAAVVARLLGQLLDALGAVHAQGVVHGDVKPSNLLLRAGSAPHLLLADFGVAAPTGRPAPRRAPRRSCRRSGSRVPRRTRARTCTPPGWSRGASSRAPLPC